ncbi:MAG TPA: hypothetical protein DDY29_02485 [Rhodobacteraceae bacterium]|nr:hypothetical protein [Paracoccaceae bacterium]
MIGAFAPMATAQQDHLSVFAGTLIMNDWNEAFAQPQDLNFTGDSLVGLAAGRDWSLGWRGLSAGIEGQLAWHFGDGYSYGQIALPAVLRYDPGWQRVLLRSFAYGLGLSYTTEISQPEVEKGGQSQRTMFYWFLETEFGRPERPLRYFARLHHRSTGFGAFGEAGSSNYLLVGVRRRF